MGRRTSSRAPGARGWLLAACSAALAVTAHGTAGGALSDSALSALLTAVLAWGGTALARRGGLLTVVAALGVTQLAQHLLLTEIADGAHAGHSLTPPPLNGWVMLATHAIATLLTAALLLRADHALAAARAAVAWLVGRLRTLCPVPPEGGAETMHTSVPARPGLVLEVLLREISPRRGPPAHS
ncbi:MAG TPA: hypothetical protein VH969_21525 [Actinophytocola sp.]|jgi:hypothetical protein|uniref:hypothetical protein n=1 Tax=Actinophytocola sp. TaxID=1872138 RepID=UPI002F95CE17